MANNLVRILIETLKAGQGIEQTAAGMEHLRAASAVADARLAIMQARFDSLSRTLKAGDPRIALASARLQQLRLASDEAAGAIAAAETATSGAVRALIGFAGVAAAAAVSVGAVFALGRSFADQVEQLDNLSRQSGVAINDLRTFQQVAKNAGAGADTLTESLYFLNRQIGQNNPLLTRLGIQSRNAGEAILELADIFDRSTDSAAKNEIAGQLLGRSGREVLKVMSGLRQVYAETNAELDKSGGLFRQSDIDAARKLDSEIDRFTTRFEGFMTRVKAASAGAANALIDHGKRVLDFYSGKINIQDVFPMGGGGPQFMSAHGGAASRLGDPNLAGALDGAARSMRDLARAYADFVEIDRRASLPTGSLFQALLGTGPQKAGGGGAGINEWVAQFERDNQALAEIARAGAFAIENAFGTVFSRLIGTTQTLASAMKTIFIGLAQSILGTIGAILGKLAVFGIGTLVGGPAGAFIQTASGFSGFRAAPARTVVNNYVQTLGVRDVIRQMTDPAGAMAMAARRRSASPA